MSGISVEFLRECFSADFEAGSLVWRRRPLEHFSTKRAFSVWNTRFAGIDAGSVHDTGYRKVWVVWRGQRRGLFVHRVLWCMQTGAWPKQTLDHKDCDKANNSIGNLREASYSDQNANRPAYRKGLKGVTFNKRAGCYTAQIARDGRAISLGKFDTEEEGNAAYIAAASSLHGEFARG